MKRTIWLVAWLLLAAMLPVQSNAVQGEIAVGGIPILNTDVSGMPLEGASFQIYRQISEEELADSNLKKEVLKIEDEYRIMTRETFWTNREMTGQKQWEVISDESGQAGMYGLAYGTYYLVETKAPTGYNRILEPVRITIHKYSHLTAADQVCDDQNMVIDNTLHIINLRYVLPETGNLSAIQVAAGGTGLLFSAAALIILKQKRW